MISLVLFRTNIRDDCISPWFFDAEIQRRMAWLKEHGAEITVNSEYDYATDSIRLAYFTKVDDTVATLYYLTF